MLSAAIKANSMPRARSPRARAERVERRDTCRDPDDRQEAVDRPDRAAGGARGEQFRQHLRCAAIEDGRIVEPRREKGEDAEEGHRADDQGDSAGPDAWRATWLGRRLVVDQRTATCVDIPCSSWGRPSRLSRTRQTRL